METYYWTISFGGDSLLLFGIFIASMVARLATENDTEVKIANAVSLISVGALIWSIIV